MTINSISEQNIDTMLGTRFQRRIMLRVGPLIFITVMLLGTLALISIRDSELEALREDNDLALVSITDAVNQTFAQVVDDAVSAATSPTLRDYALLTDLTEDGELVSDPGILRVQVLSAFDDLINDNRLHYSAIRFVRADNRVNLEVVNLGTESNIRSAADLMAMELASPAITMQPDIPEVQTIRSAAETGGEPVMVLAIPVTERGRINNVLGAVQLEVEIDIFADAIETVLADPRVAGVGRQAVIVDNNNTVLIDAAGDITEDYLALLAENPGPLTRLSVDGELRLSAEDLDTYDGETLPWRVVLLDDLSDDINALNTTLFFVTTAFLITVLALIALVWWLLRRLLRPLTVVTTVAEGLAAGSTSRTTAAAVDDHDEVERLVSAVNNIAQRINQMGETLESRDRRYNRDLEVVARIGREVATLQDIDLLMIRTINLICDEFGFYHAQIFLVDDARVNAVLVNSRGKAGQQLLGQNFKIPIGSDSVIGTVTGRGKPVIVNDTMRRTGAPHRHNPILSDTKAELGLPLIVQDEVIGALDIQSKSPEVFNERDLPIFTLIADQLAVAMYKTRLIDQSEKRINQINRLNRQLTREAWNETELDSLDQTFNYNLLTVERGKANGKGDHKPTLASEIRIRNEVIGTLTASTDDGQELTQGDEVILRAVADRVALAIENARLFQETQSTLSETSTLYKLSQALNDANTLEDIIKAIINTVVTDAIGGQIWMFEEDFTTDETEWVRVVSDVALAARSENNENIMDARLFLEDHPFLSSIEDSHIALITNVREDNRLDSGLKLTFRRVGAEAALVIPLNVRGTQRGFIMLNFPEPRSFSEREGRIYSALTDQAGVAIDNRMLLQQTEEEVARNENLYAASRIINTAQDMSDLVYAAVATANDPTLKFSLNLLEGELDENGWPTRARTVAVSENRMAREDNTIFPISVPPSSPMHNREPEIVVDDTPSNPNVPSPVEWIRSQGNRFAAYFPLFNMNQPIAIFQITSHEPYDLQPSDYEVYRALTGQMSSQIQIRGLLERTESALDETRRLYVATQSIIAAQDQRSAYEAAIEHLARPFLQRQAAGDTVTGLQISILFARPDAHPAAPILEYVVVWQSESGTNAQIEVGTQVNSVDFPYGRLTTDADGTVYFKDVIGTEDDDRLLNEPRLRAYLLEHGIASMLIHPIRSRQQWFGVIVCEGQRANAFDEQYVRFLAAVADQVGLTVENQRLFDQARFEAERAQGEAQRAIALAEAAQLASRIGDDFEESLAEVFERVAREAGFDRWMLLFMDDNHEKLVKITVEAPGFDNREELSYDLDTTIPVVEVVKLNQSVTVNDPMTYPSFQSYGEIERKGITHFFGKHISTPVRIGGIPFGSLFVGRSIQSDDLDARDEQLVETLAVQVAVAVENRRLFERVQREQQSLRAILETLPAGVLVLDPDTLKPVQFNQQAEALLAREIDPTESFTVEGYNLYRTGTQLYYPRDEMAIFNALKYGTQETVDDVAVILGNQQQIDLQVAASPILDSAGKVLYIVAAFQDISNLRSLENTLQENLRETVANLETQRQLAEAESLDEVLQVVVFQMAMFMQPLDAYVIMVQQGGMLRAEHQLVQPLDYPEVLRPVLHPEQSINLPDLAQVDIAEDIRHMLTGLGAQSMLSMPLRVGTRIDAVGWIMVISEDTGAFTPEQERQISQLADMSSTAIDNRLLIQTQQATVNEVRLLYNATNNISRSTRDMDELTTILQETMASIQPDYHAAYLDEGLDTPLTTLFAVSGPGLTAVDFGAILGEYEVPSTGLFIDDLMALTEPDDTLQKLVAAGVRSVAVINLRPKDLPGGFIVIAYEQPHHFSEAEERFMNTVSDSASIVFNNILLFEQTQATLEETSILYQASKALSDSTNSDEIIDVVVNYLVAPHVNQVFIALLNGDSWDHPGAAVQVVANWSESDGVDLEGVTLTRDQFPAWRQLATGEVLTIADIHADTDLDIMEQTGIESLDARSLTIIPLRVPKRAIGAVWIGSREAHEYNERDLRTFQAFAEQASLSLEAAYLLQQTERRARQLQTSAEVSQSASQILDLEELMPQLVSLIQESFGYDHVQIFLMDELDDYAVLRASTGEAGEQLLSINHRLQKGSQSVVGQVTLRGEPQIALDTADSNVVHHPNPYLPLTRSEMALPLFIKGEIVGALDVQSNQPNAFTEEDTGALTVLAAQISVAIDNANLYESAQQQANQMSFLFEITSTAATGETLEDVLREVAESLRVNMETLSVIAYLPEIYVNEDGTTFTNLRAVAVSGVEQPLSGIEEIRLDDQYNLLAEIGRSMQPFVIDNIASNEAYLPVAADARSAVLLPLTSSGQLIGLLVLEDLQPGAYDYDTLQILLTLGGSLSAIVQSAQLLEQLTETNEQLRELDRLKSDFLANMSHELRTPLNSIIGFSRVMLKGIDGPLTEMQEQDLTTIYTSGQHLLTLINDVLDQAKIAADKLDLKTDYFEVKPVIEAVRSIGVGLVKEKNLNLVTEIASNLPKAYGDEVRTRQVLINLVSNAAKFTQEGGITIRAYPVQDPGTGVTMIRVDVEDTGIGIAEQDLPLLFEAFRQVDSSLTRTQGGTGLGLPIAKSLTEMQGGEMTVQSKVNVGSTFSITIPIEPMADDETEETTEGGAAQVDELDPPSKPTMEMKALGPSNFSGPPPQMMAKREVLLIEDNKDMVDQFRRALQREGFDVTTADHPAYAEAMVSNLRPTVIVMDVNFAGGQGWDILRSLKDRDDTFDIPIVICTLSDDSERAYQTGAHSFVQRPFMPEDLVSAVLDAEEESNTQRILIIDDQPDAIRLLTQALNESGTYRVFSADNGKEGVSLVARRRPDLIILDLRMPEMDGFAVLQELRSNPETANIPVMVVTGEIDLNANEQELLSNIRVLHKTDISQEEYDQFIAGVRSELDLDE